MASLDYDRDVYKGSSSSAWGTSTASAEKFTKTTIDSDLKPGKKIVSKSKNPIIIALDVSGSNINFAKLVYDKLPMFYGQIVEKGYLDDFDVCICAVGDVKFDDYPIQIGTPAKGLEIDSWLEKIVLEGGGGSNPNESYEIMAHYLANYCEFEKDANPTLFFLGDEMVLDTVRKDECDKLGIECAQNYNPWPELNKKFKNNVYCMLNKYGGREFRDDFTESWKKVLPSQHTIRIPEEKAIVDLMLGVLAIQKEELDEYAADMKGRGQTTLRIEGVTSSLKALSETMALSTNVDANLPVEMKRRLEGNKGTRL